MKNYVPPFLRTVFVEEENCLCVTSNQDVDIVSGDESGWEFNQD